MVIIGMELIAPRAVVDVQLVQEIQLMIVKYVLLA